MKKRKIIQGRKRVDETYMKKWFRFSPVSQPADIQNRATQTSKNLDSLSLSEEDTSGRKISL